MRVDAQRNRARILSAAGDVFVEQGPDAPLDAIAARAGVGIATLYRRFPDRASLTREVVLDVLGRVTEEAEQALNEEPDAFQALTRYLQRALALRVSAVMPALLGRFSLRDAAVGAASARSAELLQELIDRAQAAGTLRPEVTFGDIGLLLVRLARPLPGPLPRALDDALAQRHLAAVLDGLRTGRVAASEPLPPPALTRADLHVVSPARDGLTTLDQRPR